MRRRVPARDHQQVAKRQGSGKSAMRRMRGQAGLQTAKDRTSTRIVDNHYTTINHARAGPGDPSGDCARALRGPGSIPGRGQRRIATHQRGRRSDLRTSGSMATYGGGVLQTRNRRPKDNEVELGNSSRKPNPTGHPPFGIESRHSAGRNTTGIKAVHVHGEQTQGAAHGPPRAQYRGDNPHPREEAEHLRRHHLGKELRQT